MHTPPNWKEPPPGGSFFVCVVGDSSKEGPLHVEGPPCGGGMTKQRVQLRVQRTPNQTRGDRPPSCRQTHSPQSGQASTPNSDGWGESRV